MRPIGERSIRASSLNAFRKEVSDLTLPFGFAELDFDRLDFLGWVDPKMPRRAMSSRGSTTPRSASSFSAPSSA